jgi:hypothetical protein
MKLWDKLLPQTVLTLNLLHQSNFAPTVSAYQYVHRNFNYNKMPLAPMGCAVQLHESSERQGTWSENTTDGWYIQTLPEHYRCHKIHVKKTNSKRVSDTVFFKHKYTMQPTLTSADILTKAINNLAHALKGRRNTKGIMELEALQKLYKLLNQAPHAQTPPPKQVPREEATTPMVANPVDTPTPRVDATIPHKKSKEMSQERAKMRHLIPEATNSRARIP